MKHWVSVAAINLAVAMALGAFGTHSLRDHLSEKAMRQYQTGSQYHFTIGLILLVIALHLNSNSDHHRLKWMPPALLAGCLVFSGSLYALATTGTTWWGAVTPIGGIITIGSLVGFAIQHSKSS